MTSGSVCSGLVSSGTVGMSAMEGMEKMTLVGRKGCKDVLRCIPPACALLVHNLHIVDDNFEIYNIMHFNYFYRKYHYTRRANISFGGHVTHQLVGVVRLQTSHVILRQHFIRWARDAPTC